jgi:hypothetical protein
MRGGIVHSTETGIVPGGWQGARDLVVVQGSATALPPGYCCKATCVEGCCWSSSHSFDT